jgi:hypothetical protein
MGISQPRINAKVYILLHLSTTIIIYHESHNLGDTVIGVARSNIIVPRSRLFAVKYIESKRVSLA